MIKINGMDLTRHIVIGTYNINDFDNYTAWTDIEGHQHRVGNGNLRKAKGSFTVHFRDKSAKDNFQWMIKSMGDANPLDKYSIEASINNTGQARSFFGYVSCAPAHTIRYGKGGLADFVVTVEEY